MDASDQNQPPQQARILEATLQLILDRLAALETPAPALEPEADTTPEPPIKPRPKKSLPDIPRFSGDRKDYRAWALGARSKTSVNGEAFGPPASQFAYLYASLGPKAALLVAPFMEVTQKKDQTQGHSRGRKMAGILGPRKATSR